MELDALNAFSGARRNNFNRRSNNSQQNSNVNRQHSQRPNNFRNSNYGRSPRPFLNFSRIPSQSSLRNSGGFQRRQFRPQFNSQNTSSYNSFRRSPNPQYNRRRFPNQSYRNLQRGGPRPAQSQRSQWRPRNVPQHSQMNCVYSSDERNYDYSQFPSMNPQVNFQGAQASGPSL